MQRVLRNFLPGLFFRGGRRRGARPGDQRKPEKDARKSVAPTRGRMRSSGPDGAPSKKALKNETPAMDCQGLLGFVLCYFSSYHHGSSFASDAMVATKRYCFVMFYSLPGLSSRRT